MATHYADDKGGWAVGGVPLLNFRHYFSCIIYLDLVFIFGSIDKLGTFDLSKFQWREAWEGTSQSGHARLGGTT